MQNTSNLTEAPSSAPDTALAAVTSGRSHPLRRLVRMNDLGVVAVLAALIATIGAFHPAFVSIDSLANIGQQAALYGIMALGMVFLLAMREIDLSVGALYAFVIMTAALLMSGGMNPWLAAVIGLVVAVGLGVFNGLVANTFQIATIIVTLGTMSMFRGMTLIIVGGRYVSGLPRENSFFRIFGGSLLGFPVSVWVFAVLALLLTVLFRSTRFGFVVRAIGSNPNAAQLSGISLKKVRLIVLAMVGLLAGISGLLTLGYFQTGDPNLGLGYELNAIAAAVIGGTGLAGGTGSVPGAFLGAVMISVINSGLIQFGVSPNWTSFATGAVIVAAVAVDHLVRRRQAK